MELELRDWFAGQAAEEDVRQFMPDLKGFPEKEPEEPQLPESLSRGDVEAFRNIVNRGHGIEYLGERRERVEPLIRAHEQWQADRAEWSNRALMWMRVAARYAFADALLEARKGTQ